MQITYKQYDLLQGFVIYRLGVEHYGKGEGRNVAMDNVFWAEQLDQAGIPKAIQNQIAAWAETKEPIGTYIKTFLGRLGIVVAKQ